MNNVPRKKSMPEGEKITQTNHIFMVHGFLGTKIQLLPLKWRLEHEKQVVKIWGHASLFKSIKDYAEDFDNYVIKIISRQRLGKIHFIGHSMGSIIIRSALESLAQKIPPWQQGRVVLIAPPNKGSYIANYCPSILQKSIQPIGELTESPKSFVNKLPQSLPMQTGVLWTKTDHLVKPQSVRLENLIDIKEIKGLHQTILYKKSTSILIKNFLRTGKFEPIRQKKIT